MKEKIRDVFDEISAIAIFLIFLPLLILITCIEECFKIGMRKNESTPK